MRIGNKVVFTGNDKLGFNDFGVVVGFHASYDGSRRPIVRFNGDDFDSYPMEEYLEVVSSFPVEELEAAPIEEQTIMFWNLQLQFMDMNEQELSKMSHILPKSKWEEFLDKHILYNVAVSTNFRDNLATELALQLSGLTE